MTEHCCDCGKDIDIELSVEVAWLAECLVCKECAR